MTATPIAARFIEDPPALNLAQSWVRGIIPDAANREKDDFYPTPPKATNALLDVERFDGAIWEPACGDGAISKVLEERGHEVVSTDLVDRGYGTPRVDFLMELQSLAPNIITNPPFKYMQQFIAKALDLSSGKVAMLGRLAFLEGARKRLMFESTPIARVWVFSRRIPMLRNGEAMGESMRKHGGGGMIAFAWFVWEHGYTGKPTLGWL